MIVAPKIGDGTDENPYRPDTDAREWKVIEELPTEIVIEIIQN
jgi:hypothetical protein